VVLADLLAFIVDGSALNARKKALVLRPSAGGVRVAAARAAAALLEIDLKEVERMLA